MAKPKDTLSSLFAPPDALHGIGAVLCSYSSDDDFLEQALLRFSRVPPGSRRSRGSIDFTLMLDPAHRILDQEAIPGLLQLRPKSKENRLSFHDMHAKVALLAFGSARMGEPSHYRIIVSTGNWTKESAQQLIEMAWHLDIDANSPVKDRWELFAVASFLQGLLDCYQNAESMRIHHLLQRALAFGIKAPANELIQFMQSSGQDLLHQIAAGLHGRATGCNYLVCGSGFFEQKHDPQEQPKVLSGLLATFQENEILTKSIEDKFIVTNGDREDQVIASYRSKVLCKWTLRHPKDPVSDENPRTKLHAKFIFVAKNRAESLTNCWLYLGSGNLSMRGMMLAPTQGGNIEAGVLLEVPELDSPQKVFRQLPIGKAFNKSELREPVSTEIQASEKEADQPPSPIILFQVLKIDLLLIQWDNDVAVVGDVTAILPNGIAQVIPYAQSTLALPCSEWPRSLEIQWNGCSCKVPCLDIAGDFKRQTMKNPSFGNWLDLLMGYPDTWNDPDEDADSDTGIEDNLTTPTPVSQWDLDSGGRDFPAHTAMMLVETIAERNGSIPEESSADWLHYLRHLLIEVRPESQIKGWQSLQVNFLLALLSPEGFAPTWNNLENYKSLIHQVAKEWGLDEFPALDITQ